MALPSTGTITAAMINVELGRAENAPFNINGAEERALAGKPTGAISFDDFRGKSASGEMDITVGRSLWAGIYRYGLDKDSFGGEPPIGTDHSTAFSLAGLNNVTPFEFWVRHGYEQNTDPGGDPLPPTEIIQSGIIFNTNGGSLTGGTVYIKIGGYNELRLGTLSLFNTTYYRILLDNQTVRDLYDQLQANYNSRIAFAIYTK